MKITRIYYGDANPLRVQFNEMDPFFGCAKAWLSITPHGYAVPKRALGEVTNGEIKNLPTADTGKDRSRYRGVYGSTERRFPSTSRSWSLYMER